MYVTPRQKKRYIFNALFIAIAIPITVFAGYQVTKYISDASTEAVPQGVALVTPTTNSVTVTWTTPSNATAEVLVDGVSGTSEPFRDYRGSKARKTHFVEIIDLAPDTSYSFTIVSNNKSYTSEDGRAFTFKTPPLSENLSVPNQAFGGIPDFSSDDAIVYIFTISDPQSLPVASVPTSNGNWIVDLSGLVSLDGTTFVPVTSESQIKVVVIGPDGTGSVHSGGYADTFDEDGLLRSEVDLTLVDDPDIINELPAESMVGSIREGEIVSAACFESCASLTCEAGLVCLDGVCKDASCPSETSCECDEELKECNDSCSVNTDCEGDLICTEGQCRDADCTDSEDCDCSDREGFDPDDRVFRLILDVPWIDMFPNGRGESEEIEEEEEDPELITGVESIKLVNQRDTAFGLIWMSDTPTTGSINYGESPDNLDLSTNDVRDGLREQSTYQSHLVDLFDLKPETDYYYEIISGSNTYDDDGEPFMFTTYETLGSPPPYGTVSGTVSNADPVDDVVVVLQLNDLDGAGSSGDSNLTAVVLDDNAVWVANINDARTQDGSQYFKITDGDQMTAALYVYAETVPEKIPVSQFESIIELEVFLWERINENIEIFALGGFNGLLFNNPR